MMFIESEFKTFIEESEIKLLASLPYYPQANRQAKASNKIVLDILKKTVEENPREWYERLPETLWAYQTSKRKATGTSLYVLTYGHEVILPIQITVPSLHVANSLGRSSDDYNEAMMNELISLDKIYLQVLNHMIAQKKKVSRIYNKKIRRKHFHVGMIV
ncbi:uncharacterized protein LOC129319835 [Prosopis cineraria]|uniref:uncharacterized protein LOC129319835 n=1 Tax=Prosopis cineraria TaxID=364024 RepID=UPI00240F2E83|nr:uncharacterized protein LOC129319835 [Prosopis cineraria]